MSSCIEQLVAEYQEALVVDSAHGEEKQEEPMSQPPLHQMPRMPENKDKVLS